jgi:hypothetical protein
MALEAPLRSSTGSLQFPFAYPQTDMSAPTDHESRRSPFRPLYVNARTFMLEISVVGIYIDSMWQLFSSSRYRLIFPSTEFRQSHVK